MADEQLLVSDDGATLTLTVNRLDERNQLTRPVLTRIARTLNAATARTELKCVVVRGAGDQWFAAGGDPRNFADVRTELQADAMVEQCRGALDALRDFPLPVVALLNGDAIWGGAELALACDLRLAAPHAGIGMLHSRLQITPAFGGMTDLMSLVGRTRALRMMARAERVDAATALEWGLVDAILPEGDPQAGARDFLAPLLECSPNVLRALKAQAIATRRGLPFDERRLIEQESFSRVWLDDAHWRSAARVLAGR